MSIGIQWVRVSLYETGIIRDYTSNEWPYEMNGWYVSQDE
jgi:hypothetical protein